MSGFFTETQERLALPLMIQSNWKLVGLSLLIASGIWTGSCRNNQPPPLEPSRAKSTLPAPLTFKAATVLLHYLELKDALVASDSGKSNRSAAAMRSSLVSFVQDSTFVTVDDTLSSAVRSDADTMLVQLEGLLSANDASCERQRLFFKPLSAAMYHLLQEIDMRRIMVYKQLCPMAFNEQGAYWLSLSPAIENPYFGAKMLTCGELTDTLP